MTRRTRIVRYCLKPPVAEEQFRTTRDGRIAVQLHRPRPSGATHVVVDHLGLVKKLAAIIAPPGVHRVRYFGVLASASKHRRNVVPPPALHLAPSPGATLAATASPTPDIRTPRRAPWLALLARVYGTDAIVCPSCRTGRLRVVAAITDPAVIRRILDHLEHGTRARAPPVGSQDPMLPVG